MARTLHDILQLAVARGIISDRQAVEIGALTDAPVAPSPEMARGFNWVTVAYALGALLVVFASGWFLAERWVALGAPGVLAMTVAYAATLVFASRWLERTGFPEAAGIAMMLAVSLTPVAVWCMESLSGLWPVETWGQPYYFAYPPAEASRWVVAELATILGALLVLRRREHSAMVLPIAVALFGLVMHVPQSLGVELTPLMVRWSMLTGALLVCATADAVDRHSPRVPGIRGDMAFPLWLVGLVTVASSILAFWPTMGLLRHAMPVVSVGAVAAGLYLGRRSHLVFGIALLFLYLIYLAADVFKDTAYFPLVLAALGGLLLFATVWLQRRFPALVRRMSARHGARGGLPGSGVVPWLVAGLAFGITLLKVPDAIEERIDREFQQRLEILRGHSGSRRPPPPRPGQPVPPR